MKIEMNLESEKRETQVKKHNFGHEMEAMNLSELKALLQEYRQKYPDSKEYILKLKQNIENKEEEIIDNELSPAER